MIFTYIFLWSPCAFQLGWETPNQVTAWANRGYAELESHLSSSGFLLKT